MLNIIKEIKVNKLKYSLLLVIFFMLIYLFVMGIIIYLKKQEIKLVRQDIEIKRIEAEKIIAEIVKIKLNEKKVFEEQEELRIAKEKEFQEIQNQKNINNLTSKSGNTLTNYLGEVDTVFDPISDDSIKKFVTSNKSFNNKKYVPSGLVKISSEYVFDTKGGSQLLRSIANDSLQSMAKQFFTDYGEKIEVVSAYRSYDYQKGIKNGGCPDNLCAKAGYSEHQSGLAIDLWSASTNSYWKNNEKLQKYYKWLDENAHKYGFHNTYQKGLKIDGYEIEPWHWRYVGVDLATYLRNNNLTLAQYYK
ncbi:MAG: M15 family metallopeptidase [Candidatus Gracilibacteria bacterium]|nr:M15 family metallopeptidase [Candidatus Gracilibacteria bacterium]